MVSFERSPLDGKPDVLGLDKHRRLFEIEIKTYKSDFDRDAKKPHRAKLVEKLGKYRPLTHNYLAYLIPIELVEHVRANAPDYAGIFTINVTKLSPFTGFPTLEVIRPPVRLHDTRLSMRHCAIMARDMSGTMASLLRDDVREHIRRDELERQVFDLGGDLPKRTRSKKLQLLLPGAGVVSTGATRRTKTETKKIAASAKAASKTKKSGKSRKSKRKTKTPEDGLRALMNAPDTKPAKSSKPAGKEAASGWASIVIHQNTSPVSFDSKKTKRAKAKKKRKTAATSRIAANKLADKMTKNLKKKTKVR
jgi:hypothetical protein